MAINPAIPVNGDDLDADPIRANFAAAAALETDYNAHKANTSNPHNVSAAQVGADPSGTAAAAVSAHTGAGNPHSQYALTSSLGSAASLNVSTNGTLAGNSDALIPTQKAVKTYADQLIAAADVMVFKGVINASSNPNYPAADAGWTYRISVSGKIGGASGINVEVGDLLLCLADGTVSGDQAMQRLQLVKVTMNVANGISAHVSSRSGKRGPIPAPLSAYTSGLRRRRIPKA